jgi:hypothetical protein
MKSATAETVMRFSRRSACAALLGVLLVGCGDKENKGSTEPRNKAPSSTQAQPKRSLPAHVLSDTYVGGTRTVTLRPKSPVILLQVVELCHKEDLVTETQRVRSDGGGKYTQTTGFSVRKDSDCIDDGKITPADQRPIPTPHPLQESPTEQQSLTES